MVTHSGYLSKESPVLVKICTLVGCTVIQIRSLVSDNRSSSKVFSVAALHRPREVNYVHPTPYLVH